jgi:hypothetical protein
LFQALQLRSLTLGGKVKKKLLLLTIAVLCFATFATADSFVVYSTRAAQNPSDFFDWSTIASPGTIVTSPQLVNSFTGLNTASVGNIDGSSFLTMQEGFTWHGNFDYGESLIWTGNSGFGVGGIGPMAMKFSNPVGTVGFSISADFYGAFTATLAALNSGGTTLFTLTLPGVSDGSENGSALFMGLGDLTGPNIATIQFTVSSNAFPPFSNNDFAIDDVSIGPKATPEPSSLLLLGSGLVGIVGVIRRKTAR